MTKNLREKAKKILGEGKLYEIVLYGNKIECINTNQKNFKRFNGNYFDEWHISCFDDVTDRTDSKIVNKIKDIFNCEIKILAICDSYTGKRDDSTVFKTITHGVNKSYVNDIDCTYIVCTTNKKTMLKKFNVTPEDDILISDFKTEYVIC